MPGPDDLVLATVGNHPPVASPFTEFFARLPDAGVSIALAGDDVEWHSSLFWLLLPRSLYALALRIQEIEMNRTQRVGSFADALILCDQLFNYGMVQACGTAIQPFLVGDESNTARVASLEGLLERHRLEVVEPVRAIVRGFAPGQQVSIAAIRGPMDPFWLSLQQKGGTWRRCQRDRVSGIERSAYRFVRGKRLPLVRSDDLGRLRARIDAGYVVRRFAVDKEGNPQPPVETRVDRYNIAPVWTVADWMAGVESDLSAREVELQIARALFPKEIDLPGDLVSRVQDDAWPIFVPGVGAWLLRQAAGLAGEHRWVELEEARLGLSALRRLSPSRRSELCGSFAKVFGSADALTGAHAEAIASDCVVALLGTRSRSRDALFGLVLVR